VCNSRKGTPKRWIKQKDNNENIRCIATTHTFLHIIYFVYATLKLNLIVARYTIPVHGIMNNNKIRPTWCLHENDVMCPKGPNAKLILSKFFLPDRKDFTIFRYSVTNSGLTNNRRFHFQGNVSQSCMTKHVQCFCTHLHAIQELATVRNKCCLNSFIPLLIQHPGVTAGTDSDTANVSSDSSDPF
jgi:hypothetical protein